MNQRPMNMGPQPLLSIKDLHITFQTGDGEINAVKGIDLEVNKGEIVALVGESGSGKSQTMLAIMDIMASNGRATGKVSFDHIQGVDIAKAPLKNLRGSAITMIFQEPMTSLDPLYRIGDQLIAVISRHQSIDRNSALQKAIELLNLVQIPEASSRMRSYPHEMSGGQRQRVMIAMALANNPRLLIADEPTTALDVTIQADILTLLKDLKNRLGMAIVFISHDLNVVRRFADRVYVMRHGEVVESGTTAAVFQNPRHDYTRMLIDAEPSGRKLKPDVLAPVLLKAEKLMVTFQRPRTFFGKRGEDLKAVNEVSISVQKGGTLGIVGESGSGKSTLGKALLRMLPSTGTISFDGQVISGLAPSKLRPLRRHMQIVFQDPFGSLSPRMTVGDIVSEGLLVHEPLLTKAMREQRATDALREVQLDPAMRNRYPHEFSGGQRQRIAIARAMILKPKVMVLDEPTSALDRTVQKSVIELLRKLQREHDLTYLFISHDLAVVRALADHILVMKDGLVVEEGDVDAIFSNPRSPYTQNLIKAAFPHNG
jgi:ABC-type microcin C transport system duplicated ATPase subunit YejF